MENRLRALPEGIKGYLAAFLDCEGYISVRLLKGTPGRRGDQFLVRVGFANTHFPTMQKIWNILGMGIMPKETKPTYKDIYRFQVDVRMDIWFLLDALKPYLSIKMPQAELVLEMIESKIVGSLTLERSVEIHNEVKKLNNRPQDEMIEGTGDPLYNYPG